MTALMLLSLLSTQEDPRKLAVDRDPDVRIRAIRIFAGRPEPEAVRALLPFLADPHPRLHRRAVKALSRLRDPEALEVMVRKGLRQAHPLVRAGVCEAVGGAGWTAAVDALASRLGDPHPEVRARAAEALGRLGDPALEDALLDAFCRRGEPRVVEALARLHSPHLTNIIEEATRENRYETRVVAAEVWDQADPVGAPAGIAELLQDGDWRVRSAAIQTAARLCPGDIIGPLIDRLDMENGRLKGEVYRTLCTLAGRDLGLEADPWCAWWEASRSRFEGPADSDGRASAAVSTRAAFFDLPIWSKRILFVLDLSGSMRDPAPGGGGTKLDAAKEGMIRTIRGLEPDTAFGIIGIGGDPDGGYSRRKRLTWGGRPTLHPASPGCKADAIRFISKASARGWTNLFDALALAFTCGDVDTIYLYSDGGASKGTFVAAAEILDQVRRLNRFRRIVIHTVEVPGRSNPAANRRLLQRLAETTGGSSRTGGNSGRGDRQ